MIAIQINGQSFQANYGEVRTLANLIEVLKGFIDPDSIITDLALDGRPVSENDWAAPINQFGSATLDVKTGSKASYVEERLKKAELYVEQIIGEFTSAGTEFQRGLSTPANQSFGLAVKDLGAFVSWYGTVLSMEPHRFEKILIEFNHHIGELQITCEQMMQHQLFQSWWNLGETLQNRLQPQLVELKEFCVRSAASSQALG